MSRFNLLMIAVVVAGLSFGAFLASQKSISPTIAQAAGRQATGQTSSQGQNATAGTSVDSGQSGTQVGSGTQGRPVSGSVTSVEAGILTVAAQQGDVKVKLADAKIEKMVNAATSDLRAGVPVAATGQQGPDGLIAASSLRIVAAGDTASLAFGGGRSPAQGQGQGQAAQGQGQGGQSPGGQTQRQGQSQSQGQGNSGGRSNTITGTVVSLEGTTLTVSTQQGDQKLNINGATLQKIGPGALEDLKAGERVTIAGQAGPDGVFSGATVQIVPAGEAPAQPTPTPAPKP